MADAAKKDAASKDKKTAMVYTTTPFNTYDPGILNTLATSHVRLLYCTVVPCQSTKGGKKGDTADSLPPPPTTGASHFTFANGATYDGQWILLPTADLASPRTTGPAGGSAEGAAGGRKMREGRGRWVCEGDEYEGDWVGDVMEGEGSMKFVSGARYTGQWKAGRYEGRGEYVWVDGSRYVGDWRDGRMDGEGVLEVHGSGGEVQRWQGTFANDKWLDSSTGYWSALPTPMHLL